MPPESSHASAIREPASLPAWLGVAGGQNSQSYTTRNGALLEKEIWLEYIPEIENLGKLNEEKKPRKKQKKLSGADGIDILWSTL